MPHAPDAQDDVPFVELQTLLQLPQLLTFVLRLISQPLESVLSQFWKPALQDEMRQTPVEQVAVALARLHVVPQAPQLVSVRVSVSQPSAGSPLQLAQPAAHVGTQAPFVHVVVPWALVHAVPQLPQYAVLLVRFVSQPAAAVQSP